MSAREIDFNRDIRPILSDNCFRCHGPDAAAREAELRFDTQDGIAAAREAGLFGPDSAQSEFVRRITSTDDDERMPPPDSNLNLTPAQIELLERWIAAAPPANRASRTPFAWRRREFLVPRSNPS
ncbi:MAG: c-type cytochrome domain-containing protein [Planctomycetaceae bacterium]